MDNQQAQTTEYNCGPTALSYFLALQGHIYSPSQLEQFLQPTPALGTDPSRIEAFLKTSKIKYHLMGPDDDSFLPTLVNVNHELDGDHYTVVTAVDQSSGNVTLWDPYYAELKYWPCDYFRMNWYSPLKGLKNWGLYLV